MNEKDVLILGICGSPRRGATDRALDLALDAAENIEGVYTEKIELYGKDIQCCKNCNVCLKKETHYCPVIEDDMEEKFYDLYLRCDGIILATPIYYMTATGLIQNFMSRMKPLSAYARSGVFGTRMGGGIVVGGMRNGGQDFCLSVLNNMLQATGTNIVGGGVQFYNGAAVWSQNEIAPRDQIGMLEAQALGTKLAYMCKVVKEGCYHLEGSLNSANFLGYRDQAELAQGSRIRGL